MPLDRSIIKCVGDLTSHQLLHQGKNTGDYLPVVNDLLGPDEDKLAYLRLFTSEGSVGELQWCLSFFFQII